MPDNPSSERRATGRRQPVVAPEVDSDFDGIRALAASLCDLQRQMVAAYAPSTTDIIRTRCRDNRHIEQTLDHLLDCACIPEGLALFKSLCRYYYTLNPAVTSEYIGCYREMWDSESDQEQEAAP